MATYKIKTNQAFNVNGVSIQKGLTVELLTFYNNPFNELDKINSAYQKTHGIDFKSAGLLAPRYFQYERLKRNN